MTDQPAQSKWPAPPEGELPSAHPQREADKPKVAKGGHKRHLRAPVKNTKRAATAKHTLNGS